jgi:acetylglutamate/LysW-gamma-L-alpha-aminoadipate kinase
MAEKLGVQQKFITSPEGFKSRYTDEATIEIYTMVMAGKINKEIVTRLQAQGIPAVGLSGFDGGLIKAERKEKLIVREETGRRRVINGGYTGRIISINPHLIKTLLQSEYVPVIAPVALGGKFEPLNIDGDRAAAHIAGALEADLLLLLTDVQGLLLEEKLIHSISASEVKKCLPRIGPGMITKTYAALEAISMGVPCVKIGPGMLPAPYSSALDQEFGTKIVP